MKVTTLFKTTLAASFALSSLMALSACVSGPDDHHGDWDQHDDHHDDHPINQQDNHQDDHQQDSPGNH
jgi:Spy/CpxP family protein refolding chaperone